MGKKKVLVLGAAGRDFHNFNTFFRDNEEYEVVAFTATQIPDISGRKYPAELAGALYPEGIPIYDENELEKIIKENDVDVGVLAYSDLSYPTVMHLAARVNAAGADYWLMGTKTTMIKSSKPVIAVCAVRTGCGKSQTTRAVAGILKKQGKKVAVIRHPMPYGDLVKQKVQRFASLEDLKEHECTIEEMEEYEPHIASGTIVYAGVDYGAILKEAEKEADVILWDGGNNDTPFYSPDLMITVADPHRAGHELAYYPGETNVRLADAVIINKVDSADPRKVEEVRDNVHKINPGAKIILADSELVVENPELIKGKRVLVVEDGPTLTHGGMKYGAGYVAAERTGASEVIEGRKFAVGSIKGTYEKYPHLDKILPAMGYGKRQVEELEQTINASDADAVVIGTPIDLGRIVKINKPAARVRYNLKEKNPGELEELLKL